MKNGYFQLDRRQEGTFMILYPPVDEGTSVSLTEVTEYLEGYGIDFDKKALYGALKDQTKEQNVRISTVRIQNLDETADINIAPDYTSVSVRFYPPVVGGREFGYDDVVHQLARKGIKNGIDEAAINSYLADKQYCTDYVLARAEMPVEGTDARIDYHFNTDPSKKPKLNEDGSVDFHQLDNVCHVEQDAVLATLTPAVQGKPGLDVMGKIIKPKSVVVKFLTRVKNAHISPDGLQLISDVNGHVSLIEDKIFVSDTYVVPANVDTATGDIDYNGNVEVKGNVNTGYKVNATGDVIIDGIVEGAEITAGGQIILKRGIQGMNRGKLKAAGNVVAKFIENAAVEAGGYIQTESVMHSQVQAGTELIVKGRKGFITGGSIKAGQSIEAKIIGSVMGTATNIEVGENIALSNELKELNNERNTLTDSIDKSEKVVAYITKKLRDGEQLQKEKIEQFQKLSSQVTEMKKRVEEIDKRVDRLLDKIESFTKGFVLVDDVIYPGCKVTIASVTTFIHTETKHSRLVRDGADVRVKAY